MSCPCGNRNSFEQCCGQYIAQGLFAPTPEALMRSRYSAFVLGNTEYLAKTMKGKALANFNFAGLEDWLSQVTWISLTVLKTKIKTATQGFVTFEAKYLENGVTKTILEKSEFKKIQNQWFYIEGKHLNPHRAAK